MGRVSPVEGLHNLSQIGAQPKKRWMELSTLNAKGQVMVPQAIRAALRLQPGDVLGWELDKQTARIRLVSSIDCNHLRGVEASLSEWASAADEAALSGL